MAKYKQYDLEHITTVPLPEVLADYGIEQNRSGFFAIREENTPSCKYYKDTNSFYDFGAGVGGGSIQLVMELESCNKATAIRALGERYNAPALNDEQDKNRKHLTNAQYREIGLYGDLASKNWDFAPGSTEQEMWDMSKRLSMPMNELFEKSPEMYGQMIENRAIPKVSKDKALYLEAFRDQAHYDMTNEVEGMLYESRINEAFTDYRKEYAILRKCAEGTGADVSHLRPDFQKDYEHASDDKQRLFVDMDGVLAVFIPTDKTETLLEEGYFLNLPPQENVLQAVKDVIQNNPEKEVYVLSSVLSDSDYAEDEKNAWLDKNLPEVPKSRRIFPTYGEDKKDYIPYGIRENDFLLDDYTRNLAAWQPPARGIKLLNGINHTKGTWEHDRIRYDKSPSQLAANIVSIMNGEGAVMDMRPHREDGDVKEIPSAEASAAAARRAEVARRMQMER